MTAWLRARLRERSTWVGIAGLIATLAGYAAQPELVAAVVTLTGWHAAPTTLSAIGTIAAAVSSGLFALTTRHPPTDPAPPDISATAK